MNAYETVSERSDNCASNHALAINGAISPFSEYIIIHTSPPTPASCNGNSPPNKISPGRTIALLAPAEDTLFELNGANA